MSTLNQEVWVKPWPHGVMFGGDGEEPADQADDEPYTEEETQGLESNLDKAWEQEGWADADKTDEQSK